MAAELCLIRAAAGTAAIWRVMYRAMTWAPSRLVTDMVADPARPADLRVKLVARQQTLTVGSRSIPGFTVNGTSPGPEIRAVQGQLIEVQLRNESVADGVTLHWHGVDLHNAMDGVAGVAQVRCRSVVSSPTASSLIRSARTGITPIRSPTRRSPEGCSDPWW